MNKRWRLMIYLAVLCGCSSQQVPQAETVSDPFDTELFIKLDEEQLFDGPMIELTNDQIKGYYQHPEFDTLVSKTQVYASNGTHINEVAIFEAKPEFEAVLWSRINELKRSAELYFPTEISKIDNYILIKKEPYFIMIIVKDHQAAAQIVTELFN